MAANTAATTAVAVRAGAEAGRMQSSTAAAAATAVPIFLRSQKRALVAHATAKKFSFDTLLNSNPSSVNSPAATPSLSSALRALSSDCLNSSCATAPPPSPPYCSSKNEASSAASPSSVTQEWRTNGPEGFRIRLGQLPNYLEEGSRGAVCCFGSGSSVQGYKLNLVSMAALPGDHYASFNITAARLWKRAAQAPTYLSCPLSSANLRVDRFHNASSHARAAQVETRVSEAVLRKGALVEFERESGKPLLAVAQAREGKKNWTAIDQSGHSHVVKPQQITFLVPNPNAFEPSDILTFLGKVESLQDLGLLEFAWEEILTEQVPQVQAECLAKILYSQDTAVECYTVHRMLSGSQIFFRCKQKGLTPVYEPRTPPQVKELQQKRQAEEKALEQLSSYVKLIKVALKCPQNDKPSENTWHEDDYVRSRTEALKAYALSSRPVPAQKKVAEEVLDVMGLTKNPAVAVNLLIGMGVLPLHVNVDLLKVKDQLTFTEEHHAAVEQLCEAPPVDPDVGTRVDLTAMKVYTIDSDDTNEIDDGLSAARLPDGRIKVWIHVADPTRWLRKDHVLTREAESRGTSTYLPTGTIPMFPIELAAGPMSLRQGHDCCAVTVAVVLCPDGSIFEYAVMNSTVRPTYKLSYDNVTELLLMHVEEEPELYLLAEAASRRATWRASQGAILTFLPEADIKITDPDSTEPAISLEVKDQSTPAMQLVSEMMILCGEAVSLLGQQNSLCLPYRGQAQTDYPKRGIFSLPDGPCRAFAMRRLLGSADMSFTRPIPHASLGLPGYVQFTSPIRRFADLISHYQVKAHMRGEAPPFASGNVEAKMAMANLRTRDARRLQLLSLRYWTIEYLRRQPKDRLYPAIVLQGKKDGDVSVLLLEVGFRSSATLVSTPSVGSEITVVVVLADPRKDVICLRQC